MKYYKEYEGHLHGPLETVVDRKGNETYIDSNIYTLDIESSSYFVDLDGIIHNSDDYPFYNKKDAVARVGACLYIWQFSINDTVYYGRTKEDLRDFLKVVFDDKYEHIVWVHNLSFEFEFLQDTLKFTEVFARKPHKPMKCRSHELENVEFRCSLMLSGTKLASLTSNYNLDVEKAVGDLDYVPLRTPETPLTEEELHYCEMDCIVLYKYIQSEKKIYGDFSNFPLTSTGKVRNEFRSIICDNREYKQKVDDCFDTNPDIYNALMRCYAGGYTHANRFLSDEIYENVTSLDFTSSYPFALLSERYPSSHFKKIKNCKFFDFDKVDGEKAYLLHVRFKCIHVKTQNTFISVSKKDNTIVTDRCRRVVADNGRLISADYFDMWITDVDWQYIKLSYGSGYKGRYPLIVSLLDGYKADKDYLPKEYLDFILRLYVNKTRYKNVSGKEGIYNLSKSMLNSLYGMAVTNTITDEIIYDGSAEALEDKWMPKPINVAVKLRDAKKKAILSMSWGVYCSAYARNNLLQNVIKLDEYCCYCDTDSMKLLEGFDKSVIKCYNDKVCDKLRQVSDHYGITFEQFEPVDCDGMKHLIGVFDFDGEYNFITLGAKKYAVQYTQSPKNKPKKRGTIEITVSGVPKEGSVCLDGDINNFRDDLVFEGLITGKSTHFYCELMPPTMITDYLGNSCVVDDCYGVALMPCDYRLRDSVKNEYESGARTMYE